MSMAVQAFMDRLENLITVSRNSGITCSEVIGCLELVKLDVYQEILNQSEDEDE
jgi:hypothetical protein